MKEKFKDILQTFKEIKLWYKVCFFLDLATIPFDLTWSYLTKTKPNFFYIAIYLVMSILIYKVGKLSNEINSQENNTVHE